MLELSFEGFDDKLSWYSSDLKITHWSRVWLEILSSCWCSGEQRPNVQSGVNRKRHIKGFSSCVKSA